MLQGANISRGKKQNLESIKTMVYKHGPISRQEIATSLNLTLPTITTTVSSYLKTGLFREVEEPLDKTGTRPKQTGRPTLYLEYASTIWYFLGVEFWSGGIGCCLTDIHGNILHSKTATYPSTQSYSYENMIEDVGNTALLTIKESGIPKEKVLGLGVGLPGPVNQKLGILYSAGSFDWGENRTAAEDLSQKTGLVVLTENNARMRAIGEEMKSEITTPSMFAYLLVARGVVCPIVFNNSVMTGDLAGAGEISHVLVGGHSHLCPDCGNVGCLNEIGSQQAILKRAAELRDHDKSSLLYQATSPQKTITMEDVLAAQKQGDRAVNAILTQAITSVAMAASYVISLLSPHLLLVDGQVMELPQNREVFLSVVHANIHKALNTEIKFVPYDVLQGARGSALLVVKRLLLQNEDI